MKNECPVKIAFKLSVFQNLFFLFRFIEITAESLSFVTFCEGVLLWRQYGTLQFNVQLIQNDTRHKNSLLNTQWQVQPSRRQCKDIAGNSNRISIFRYVLFAREQFTLHIVPIQCKVILLTGQEVPPSQSSQFPVLLSETSEKQKCILGLF